MKYYDIIESASAGATGAGSVAPVNFPMGTQKRNPSIYNDSKVGNLLTGKKAKGKYANSIDARKQTKVTESKEQIDEIAPAIAAIGSGLLTAARFIGPRAIEAAKWIWKNPVKSTVAGVTVDATVNNGQVTKDLANAAAEGLIDTIPEVAETAGNTVIEVTKGLGSVIWEMAQRYPWAAAAITAFFAGTAAWKVYVARQEHLDKKEQQALIRLQAQTLDELRAELRKSNQLRVAPDTIAEEEVKEQEILVIPGTRKDRKSGFITHAEDRRDHEVEMARTDLYSIAKNAQALYKLIKDRTEDEGLMGWQQSYITLASDYLNSVRESVEHDVKMSEASEYGQGEDDRINSRNKLDKQPKGKPSSSYPGGTLTGTSLAEDAEFIKWSKTQPEAKFLTSENLPKYYTKLVVRYEKDTGNKMPKV